MKDESKGITILRRPSATPVTYGPPVGSRDPFYRADRRPARESWLSRRGPSLPQVGRPLTALREPSPALTPIKAATVKNNRRLGELLRFLRSA